MMSLICQSVDNIADAISKSDIQPKNVVLHLDFESCESAKKPYQSLRQYPNEEEMFAVSSKFSRKVLEFTRYYFQA